MPRVVRRRLNESAETRPSLEALPYHLLAVILSRLSLQSIAICRCVCKTFLSATLDPGFAKLHFETMPSCALLQTIDSGLKVGGWNVTYLPDFQRGHASDHYLRYFDDYLLLHDDSLVPCTRLRTNFALPSSADLTIHPEKRKRKTMKPGVPIVNSCNGLLCLKVPLHSDDVVLYNPFLGEFVTVQGGYDANSNNNPMVHFRSRSVWLCGLGFSKSAKECKILRVLCGVRADDPDVRVRYIADILTVGRGSKVWRKVAEVATVRGPNDWTIVSDEDGVGDTLIMFIESYRRTGKGYSPTYLHGGLHWLVKPHPQLRGDFIVCFDFAEEKFRAIPPPPPLVLPEHRRGEAAYVSEYLKDPRKAAGMMRLGFSRGCICLCDASTSNVINVWVMKQYGEQSSWQKMIKCQTENLKGPYQPIVSIRNGELWLYHLGSSAYLSCTPNAGDDWGYNATYRYYRIRGPLGELQAIAHTPSLISLNQVIDVENEEIKTTIFRDHYPQPISPLFIQERHPYLQDYRPMYFRARNSSKISSF